jgi:hypothetical protein
VPALAELIAITPRNVFLALELKTDRFLEPAIGRQLVDRLCQAEMLERTVLLSFSLERLLAVQRAEPEIAIGLVTYSRWLPFVPTQLIGPLWPLLLINPFYTFLAHRRGMLVCPLDPWPDSRLWLYRLLRCDAVLTNDPASTIARLGRV